MYKTASYTDKHSARTEKASVQLAHSLNAPRSSRILLDIVREFIFRCLLIFVHHQTKLQSLHNPNLPGQTFSQS